ncbi:MAG: ATP-binding protein [Phototrophicaceae bacterium]|jgi:signal transduction histidine kinase
MTDSTEQIIDLENQLAVMQRLLDISAQLNSTIQLDELLRRIMDIAAEVTDCEAASVLLWNATTRELFIAATTSESTSLIGQVVPLEGSIAGTILRERRALEVDDTAADPRHYGGIDQKNAFYTRSLLGVPMTVKNRPIGVLEVLNKRSLPWTDNDKQYLTVISAQAAVAIESAQLVASMRRANEELAQVDKLKSDFIAIASHELRTPLGVILGYASFLQEDTNSDGTRDLAQKVVDSALRLRKIIEDLTNLRYLQENAADMHFMPMTVDQLLTDVRLDSITLMEAKGQRLQIVIPPAPIMVKIDRGRLSMALMNILVNAIEFTPNNDRILIEAEIHHTEVWIKITDHGIGLAPEHLTRIFERFFQVEDHQTRHHQGLGIGLSISKAIIEAHSGRVWASSDGVGKGATFTVSLPIA